MSPTFNGISLDQIDRSLTDAFGRLRVSDSVKNGGFSQDTNLKDRLITEGQVSGTGTTSAFDANSSSTALSVTSTNVGKRLLRTQVAGLYQPGKSLMVQNSFNFRSSSGTVSWVEKSSVTGSPVETVIAQASWNVDTMNGNGVSGINLDWTKSQLTFMSFAWLGVGLVVCGFIVDGKLIIAHIFSHVNILTSTNPTYIKTARLFPSFSIEQTSTEIIKEVGYFLGNDGIALRQRYNRPGTTQSLTAICASILTEGVEDQASETYAIHRVTASDFNTSTANNTRALILFRLNPAAINARVKFINFSSYISSNAFYYTYILRAPDITGYTPTWTSLANTSLQYDLGAPNTLSISNYYDVIMDMAGGNSAIESQSKKDGIFNYLGASFDGTPLIYALAVRCDTANETVKTAHLRFAEDI